MVEIKYADAHAHLPKFPLEEKLDAPISFHKLMDECLSVGVDRILSVPTDVWESNENFCYKDVYRMGLGAMGIGRAVQIRRAVGVFPKLGLNDDSDASTIGTCVNMCKQRNGIRALLEDPNLKTAQKTVLDILKEYDLPSVTLHYFLGSDKQVDEAMDRGYHVSVSPLNCFYPNKISERMRRVVKRVPIKQMLTESDAPRDDLTPTAIPGLVNKISEIKGMELEETAKVLYENFGRLYY